MINQYVMDALHISLKFDSVRCSLSESTLIMQVTVREDQDTQSEQLINLPTGSTMLLELKLPHRLGRRSGPRGKKRKAAAVDGDDEDAGDGEENEGEAVASEWTPLLGMCVCGGKTRGAS